MHLKMKFVANKQINLFPHFWWPHPSKHRRFLGIRGVGLQVDAPHMVAECRGAGLVKKHKKSFCRNELLQGGLFGDCQGGHLQGGHLGENTTTVYKVKNEIYYFLFFSIKIQPNVS